METTNKVSVRKKLIDNHKTLVKIKGCEWKITEDQIIAWLGHFGTVESELGS